MKGVGRYTIFHYFPKILCQTMGDQVMWPKNTAEHAQDTGSVHWACPVCQTPAFPVPNDINIPPQVHSSTGWPGLLEKTSKLHVADNSQVDRTFLFIFNYFIIELLFNYTKCLNIIRTSSRTLYCTLQGHTLRYTITTYFRITNTFTDCRLLETHCPDFWTLIIIEGCFLQSLLLNKHYFKNQQNCLTLSLNNPRYTTLVLFCQYNRGKRRKH